MDISIRISKYPYLLSTDKEQDRISLLDVYFQTRHQHLILLPSSVAQSCRLYFFFQAMIIKEALIEHSESNLVTVQANF